MTTLIMTVGLPGSGKSTLASKLAEEYEAEIFSSDALRRELYGSEAVQEHNEKVFDILIKRMISALKEGKNVIFDAMNINSKNRRHTLNVLSKYADEKIAYLLVTPYEMCLERNKKRERNVPEEVIKRAYMQFTVPCEQEGFNEIKLIYPEGFDCKKYEKELWEKLDGIPHDNPYHRFTIKEHMVYATLICFNRTYPNECDYVLHRATMFHDIGKPFCKFFSKDGIAHYYGHDHVGAYESLLLDSIEGFKIDIALVIQYHMKYYTAWKDSEKSLKRDQEFLGPELFEKIEMLHKYDKEAH